MDEGMSGAGSRAELQPQREKERSDGERPGLWIGAGIAVLVIAALRVGVAIWTKQSGEAIAGACLGGVAIASIGGAVIWLGIRDLRASKR